LNNGLLWASAHRVYHRLHSSAPSVTKSCSQFYYTTGAVKDLLT
jgi:hypothetical protein